MSIEAPEVHWPARDADERTMLEGFLEAYRGLAVRKVAGLDAEQLATCLAPSKMTLGGLLKHLAAVEDDWFHGDVAGNDYPEPWASVDPADAEDWTWKSAADEYARHVGHADLLRESIDGSTGD